MSIVEGALEASQGLPSPLSNDVPEACYILQTSIQTTDCQRRRKAGRPVQKPSSLLSRTLKRLKNHRTSHSCH